MLHAALRLAAELGRAFDGRLLIVHILPIEMPSMFVEFPTPASDATLIDIARDRFARHVAEVLGEGPPPAYEVEVRWGIARLDIVPYAIERRADVIVIGTHGRTGITHVLLGSVAERVVRTAACPVGGRRRACHRHRLGG